MQIDWVTAIAQAVNFLVLVWLLHHFLYGRILDAVDRREERIRQRLQEADEKKQSAEQELAQYREQLEELERNREDKMRQAAEEAEEAKRSLREEARHEVEQLKEDWLQRLEEQRDSFQRSFRERSARQFFAMAERALRDLADQELEDQMCAAFRRRLEDLQGDQRKKLRSACASADNKARILSRFELSSGAKRDLTRTVHEVLSQDVDVEYQSSEETPVGIEMRCGSQSVSWSLERYLDDLEEQSLAELAASEEG